MGIVIDPPTDSSRHPDRTKWFEKEDFVKLPSEWKRYCSHMRYEVNQMKKKIKSDGQAPTDDKKKTGSNNRNEKIINISKKLWRSKLRNSKR